MDQRVIEGLYSPGYNKPLIICFKMLNYCNINFFDDNVTVFKKYWKFTLIAPCVLLYYISLVVNIITVISNTKDVIDLAYTAPIMMIATQAIIKAAIIIPKKAEIKQIIEELGAMWKTSDLTNTQLKKRNTVLTKIDICQRVFYCTSMLGSSMYTLSPLLETLLRRFILKQDFEWLLPYPCSYPFHPTKTFFRYIALYIFQTFSMFICIFAYLGCEFLMVAICSHLVAEFTILREDLRHLKPTRNKKRQRVEEDDGDIEINDLIKRHQKLISLSQRLDDSFNRINFVILLFATIITCFFAFTAKVSNGGVFMITNYIAVAGMMVPLFILCYFSELLAKESSGIPDAAYENLWYEGGTSYQKSICFVMARAQRPCCLTSLKFAPINLASFSKVLSTTWSYFSLILRVYEDIN